MEKTKDKKPAKKISEFSKTCMLCGKTFWSKKTLEEHAPDCIRIARSKMKGE